jgi:fermentation-respiration switch protein FrsA (DUF1100 family)
LIVESTFTSIVEVARLDKKYWIFPIHMIVNHQFDSISKVEHLKVPILFIHGTVDDLIPFQMSVKLFDRTASFKRLLLIPGGGHSNNATVGGSLYLTTVSDFVDSAVRERVSDSAKIFMQKRASRFDFGAINFSEKYSQNVRHGNAVP